MANSNQLVLQPRQVWGEPHCSQCGKKHVTIGCFSYAVERLVLGVECPLVVSSSVSKVLVENKLVDLLPAFNLFLRSTSS